MTLYNGAIGILTLGIAWTLYRAHKDKDLSNFNLFDLLMEGGRVSRLACAFLASFIMTSAIMWKLAIEGKMTEGYFIAYGGMWVAPIIAKLFAPAPMPQGATEKANA